MMCIYTSLPKPIRYQWIFLPWHMLSPGRFPYRNPLIPVNTVGVKGGVCVHGTDLYNGDASPCILLLSMNSSSSFRPLAGFVMYVRMLSSRYQLKFSSDTMKSRANRSSADRSPWTSRVPASRFKFSPCSWDLCHEGSFTDGFIDEERASLSSVRGTRTSLTDEEGPDQS